MPESYSNSITRQNLEEKISLAKQLGFHDDVAHWTTELANLESTNA